MEGRILLFSSRLVCLFFFRRRKLISEKELFRKSKFGFTRGVKSNVHTQVEVEKRASRESFLFVPP